MKLQVPTMISQSERLNDGLFRRIYRTLFPSHSTSYRYQIRRRDDEDFSCNGDLPRKPKDSGDAAGMMLAVVEEYHHSARPLTIEMVRKTVTVKGSRRDTLTVYGPTLWNV
jgi:hypothetical protein